MRQFNLEAASAVVLRFRIGRVYRHRDIAILDGHWEAHRARYAPVQDIQGPPQVTAIGHCYLPELLFG